MIPQNSKLLSSPSPYALLTLFRVVPILFIINFLQSAQSQQCPFPSQRCICLSPTSSPLCRCPFLTSESTLNYTMGYRSSLVLVSGMGCQPCHYSCLECNSTSIGGCLSCVDEFVLVGGMCLHCPINCRKCKSSSGGNGLVCVECIGQYYLDRTQKCMLCPFQGSQICTIDSITSCIPSYWLDSNGALCLKCAENCRTCVSGSRCGVCQDGYVVVDRKCVRCGNGANGTAIGSGCCGIGQYYDGTTCSSCGAYCLSCVSYGNCVTCGVQGQLIQFTLNNGVCTPTSVLSLIPNCLQNKPTSSSSSTLQCEKCLPGYFQQISSNICYYGCSIMCKECQGAHFGLCTQCQSGAILFNRHCLARNNLDNGTSFQIYFNGGNGFQSGIQAESTLLKLFFANYQQLTQVSRLNNNCLKQTIITGKKIVLTLKNLQSYRIALKWKIYILTPQLSSLSSEIPYTLTFSSSSSVIPLAFHFTCSIAFPCSSSNLKNSYVCISKSNVTISGGIRMYNNVTFSIGNGTQSQNLKYQNYSIGFSEMLAVGYRCGGVSGIGCLQCQDINTCIKCVNPNYYILGPTCIQTCPPTHLLYFAQKKCYNPCPISTFPSPPSCLACPVECLTCTSTQICLSCLDNFYLHQPSSTCLPQCPSTFFPNSFSHKCQTCLFPCLQCSSNNKCTSCIYGFFGGEGSGGCGIVCPTGTYGDLKTRLCQKCLWPCRTCGAEVCWTCEDGYGIRDGKCVQNCGIGYFLGVGDNEVLECQACDSTCKECKNLTYCTQCLTGYLYNNKCQISCPISFYPDSLSLTCTSCPLNCLICSNSSHCSLCLPPFSLSPLSSSISLPQSCLTSCPSLFFSQFIPYAIPSLSLLGYWQCISCVPPCHTCTGPSQCLSCMNGFLLESGCVQQCIDGTYGVAQAGRMVCIECQSGCLRCDATGCLECIKGLDGVNGSGCLKCQTGYYQDGGACARCAIQCEVCTNGTYCQKCAVGFVGFGGRCGYQCAIGYWADRFLTRSCIKCQQNCQICTSSACLLCASPFLLLSPLCVSACPPSHFQSPPICHTCIEPCLTCLSQTECLTCLDGYGYLFQGDCIISCPYGYFAENNNGSGICVSCGNGCLGCDKNGQCLQCAIGYLERQNGLCLDKCVDLGVFQSEIMKQCLDCTKNCENCVKSQTNCTKCAASYYLYNTSSDNQCLSICPKGYYSNKNNSMCEKCDTQGKCGNCLTKEICIQCKKGYLYAENYSSKCIDYCGKGYYGYAGICYKCKYPCLQCDNLTICTLCASNYILLSQPPTYICTLSCPTNFFTSLSSSSSPSCIPCPFPCLQCLSPSLCLSCSANFFLITGQCLPQCPLGTYKFYGTCSPCMYGCRNCTDGYSCEECGIGFLYEGACVNRCPYGLIQFQSEGDNSTKRDCVACSSECQSCRIEPTICTSCRVGMYLHLDKCLGNCVAGTYPDDGLGQCVTCTRPCQTCANSNSCETCIYGYILYVEKNRNQCVKGPICPNSYYLDIAENYCKLSCEVSKNQFSQPISRTCSKNCPIGFVAYQQNKTCLYTCPGNSSDFWIDQNLICRYDRGRLTENFIENYLPYFKCKASSYRNLMQIICTFSVAIANLQQIEISNIVIEQMEVLQFNVLEKYWGLQIFVQPISKQVTQFNKKWLKISFKPYYSLRSLYFSESDPSLRLLSESPSYPLQSPSHSIFISSFTFLSPEERQTSLYFKQLANGICIAGLIIWLFSFIKNKKITCTCFVLGAQWIYLMSTYTNQNQNQNGGGSGGSGGKIGVVMEGFAICFGVGVRNGNENAKYLIKELQVRMGLLIPNNLVDFWNIGISLGVFYGIFVGLYLILLTTHYILKKVNEKNQENQGQQSNSLSNSSSSFLKMLQKKISILLLRFPSNYIYQLLLLTCLPVSFCFFLQVQLLSLPSPPFPLTPISLVPIILCSVLVCASVLSIGLLIHSRVTSPSLCLYVNQAQLLYILYMIENVSIGLISVIGDSNSMNSMVGFCCVIWLLNICVYCYVYRRMEWRFRYMAMMELSKIGVTVGIFLAIGNQGGHGATDGREWAGIISIVLYVIMLAVYVARDFFQEESIAFKELIEMEKEEDTRKHKYQKNSPLLQIKGQNYGENQKNKNDQQIKKYEQSIKYQSQQSFFEDAVQANNSESQEQDQRKNLEHEMKKKKGKSKQNEHENLSNQKQENGIKLTRNRHRISQKTPQILVKQTKNF